MSVYNFFNKLINFIRKKFFSFPTLNFLMTSKSRFLKNLYVNFWIFISKKNKSFKKYFFDFEGFEKKNIFCKLDNKIENLNKEYLNALSKNGILILETPDFDSAAARRYGNNFRLLKDRTHVSLFSTESLIRFVKKNKFKLFDINFPFFETPYFTKKNLLKLLDKRKVSPPFYGSVVTLFLKK